MPEGKNTAEMGRKWPSGHPRPNRTSRTGQVSRSINQGAGYINLFPPMIQYELAEDIAGSVRDIIHKLRMNHIHQSRLICVRSKGSGSKRIIARCHSLPRIMQLALNQKPHYIVEIISERFDKLSKEEQTKILIHELMHIPHAFGGGFRAHRPYVTRRKVEGMYKQFLEAD